MATYLRQKPPAWFWIVAVVLLLWGAMGVFACVQQFRLGADAMGPATDYDRSLYASLPVWYNYVYAVSVGAGFLGAVALLARSALAWPLFVVSLVTVLIMFGYIFGATDLIAVKGAAATVPSPIFITVIAILQIWFAGLARRRGWIG